MEKSKTHKANRKAIIKYLFLTDGIPIFPNWVHNLGPEEAILLGCLKWMRQDQKEGSEYEASRSGEKNTYDGWTTATIQEIYDTSGLNKDSISKILKKFIGMGLLVKRLKGIPPKPQYQLDNTILSNLTFNDYT